MPSGTGKTVSLLSLIVSYIQVRRVSCISYSLSYDFLNWNCFAVLPDEEEIDLLLTYGSRDREGLGGAETSYGLSGAACGDTGTEGEGESFYGPGAYESEELVLASGGTVHPSTRYWALGHTKLISTQVSKERKGVVVDARCRDLTSAGTMEKSRNNPGSVPTCSFHDVSAFHFICP